MEELEAAALLGDKGYDADERVIHRLEQAGKQPVIPPKRNRRELREYARKLYKARN